MSTLAAIWQWIPLIALTGLSFAVAGCAAAACRCHLRLYAKARRSPVLLATTQQLEELPVQPWHDGKGRWPEPEVGSGASERTNLILADLAQKQARRQREAGQNARILMSGIWAVTSTVAISTLSGLVHWISGPAAGLPRGAALGAVALLILGVVTMAQRGLEARAEVHEERAAAYWEAADALHLSQEAALEATSGCMAQHAERAPESAPTLLKRLVQAWRGDGPAETMSIGANQA